ncbi:MAG: hypothetical protein ACTSQA_07935, partial [Candidatus Heimdallarchaeaceae archaeon]
MSKYDELYEGIISKIGKKIGGVLKKGAEKVEKGAEGAEAKVKGAVEKGKETVRKGKEAVGKASRTVAKKTIEKTPLGFVKTANRALTKLNKEFEYIVKSAKDQSEYIKKLGSKISDLKGKISNRYQDDTDNTEVANLLKDIETFEKNAKAIASSVKAAGSRASNLTGIGKEVKEPVNESYSEDEYELFCEEWDKLMEDLDV